MPQLMVLALVGAGIYAGYRWLWRPVRTIAAQVRRAEDEIRRVRAQGSEKDMGALEYDPISGVYRPVRRR